MFVTNQTMHPSRRLRSTTRRASAFPCSYFAVRLVFICAMALSITAFMTRTPLSLSWLTGADLLFLLITRPGLFFLRRMGKAMLWQAAIISGLYCLRFGFTDGIIPGLTISWQLGLTFLPGAVIVETIPSHKIVTIFSDILPYRIAFIMATCLNFIPLLLTETKGIYQGQSLRGARILPRDLLNPLNWPDVIHCLVVPVMIQAMALATQIALAAKARDFGLLQHRTSWPGEREEKRSCKTAQKGTMP